ncbi:MAG: hypothetical protein ABJE66_11470 [Deltaproteobacteria bacterium]
MRIAIGLVLLCGSAVADDGYCDYVRGVASATSATQLAPELVAQFGYIEQAPTSIVPEQTSNSLRLIAGLRYRMTGVYEGLATRDHAAADCTRHRALEQLRGETLSRALTAKAAVLDAALGEADKLGIAMVADLEAHRKNAQDATALRLRVDELRELAAEAHRQLGALPAPRSESLGRSLTSYRDADAAMETAEGKLRRAQAVDVSVRFGVDELLGRDNPMPFFAVVSVGLNVGLLWQGGANDRAAAGRKHFVETGHDPLGVDATLDRIASEIAVETQRETQVAALVNELDGQLAAVAKIGGDDAKKYRDTIWFDWIKARAEQAYLRAHLASLRETIER